MVESEQADKSEVGLWVNDFRNEAKRLLTADTQEGPETLRAINVYKWQNCRAGPRTAGEKLVDEVGRPKIQ